MILLLPVIINTIIRQRAAVAVVAATVAAAVEAVVAVVAAVAAVVATQKPHRPKTSPSDAQTNSATAKLRLLLH